MHQRSSSLYCILMLTLCSLGRADLFSEEGVMVYAEGEVRTLTGSWTTVILLHPPEVPRIKLWLEDLSYQITELEEEGMVGAKEVGDWREHMDFLMYDITTLYPKPSGRARRSPFDFVGTLARALFGTATTQQIADLTTTVMATQKGVLALAHHHSEMISIMNQTRLYIKEDRMDIQQLQVSTQAIARHIEILLKKFSDFEKTIHKMHLRRDVDVLFRKIDRAMGSYHRLSDTFHRQRIQLERGFLTDEIMPEVYLQQVLDKLDEAGHDHAPLRWYYQHCQVRVLIDSDEQLIFQTILPGLSNVRYLRYTLQYFPVPHSNLLLRQIKGRKDVVLNSVSSSSFVPVSCMGRDPTVCAATVEETVPTCESNILTGTVPENCEAIFTKRGNKTSDVYREEGQLSTLILVPYIPTETTLRCPGKHPVLNTYDTPVRLQIEAGCTVQSQHWRFRSIDQGQSSIQIPSPKVIALPGFNLTRSFINETPLLERMQFVSRTEIPLLAREEDVAQKPLPTFLGFSGKWPGITLGGVAVCVVVSLIFYVRFQLQATPIVDIFKSCKKRLTSKSKPSPPSGDTGKSGVEGGERPRSRDPAGLRPSSLVEEAPVEATRVAYPYMRAPPLAGGPYQAAAKELYSLSLS